MGKKKTRKQKDQAQLRRQVEALKAELKAYKPSEEKPAKKEPEVVAKKAERQEIRVEKSFIKKDLRKTLIASAISLGVLAGAYFFLDDLIQKIFHYNIAR